MDNIEDKLFTTALEAKGIRRTKSMYTSANLPHVCSMCRDENERNLIGYKLRPSYVSGLDTPYLFICNDCFETLEE